MNNMYVSCFLSRMASPGLLLIYYLILQYSTNNTDLFFLFFTKEQLFSFQTRKQLCQRSILVSSIFDLPAKSLVLEEIQFNGFCGCSYCVEAGKSVVQTQLDSDCHHKSQFDGTLTCEFWSNIKTFYVYIVMLDNVIKV